MKKTARVICIVLIIAQIVTIPLSALATENSYSTITFGQMYALAIKTDGSLWAWGFAPYGEIGNGEANFTTTTPIKIMDDVVSVSAGTSHTMAIKTDGSLWAWGHNGYGQLGDGTRSQRLEPVKVMENVACVSAKGHYTMAVKTDGSLWAWGRNEYGQLGNGTTVDSNTPVKITDNVVSVSAGGHYVMAIKTDGSLWAWGFNSRGEFGNGSTTSSKVPLKVLDDVSSVFAGQSHTAAIKTDGSLWTWGTGGWGMLGDGNNNADSMIPVKVMDDAITAALGGQHTLAIKQDGSLWACGMADYGQIGDGANINPGEFNANRRVPVKIMDAAAVVAAGRNGSMAVKTDGSLWAWGVNGLGQLGDGTTTDRNTPVKIMDGVKIPTATQTPSTPSDPLDSASAWAVSGITAAIEKGFVPIDIQGNYKNIITRQEFCRMAVKWMEYVLQKPISEIVEERGDPAKAGHMFSDTVDSNILAAYRLGITNGIVAPTATSPGRFNPSGEFDRQQAATMVMNVCKAIGADITNLPTADFEDMDKAAVWAVDGINFVRANGIMSGTSVTPPMFSPLANYTREQSIVTFNNIRYDTF